MSSNNPPQPQQPPPTMKRLSKRKCEMWISNNKVLIGNGKKPNARNPNFETEETKLLISLWGDPKVQKTLITSHKKHPVILQLAEQMREHGYFRSPDEINTRIKNLKCFYNRIKKDVDMGIVTDPTWKHYKSMEEILTRPVFGNRVQQPHLQHLLQQADTQHALGNISPIDSEMADGESGDSLRPEDLLSVKEDDDADMDFDNGSLVPKDEPLDIDEMEGDTEKCDVGDVDDIFPKLSQYLQLAASNSKKNASKSTQPAVFNPNIEIKLSPRSSPGLMEQITTPTAQLLSALSLTPAVLSSSNPTISSVMSACTTTKPVTTSTTPSATPSPSPPPNVNNNQKKISLVPTNILMKPPQAVTPTPPLTAAALKLPATTQLTHQHMQPQSINFGGDQYVCANTVSNGKTVYTSAQKDGQPMKVLLVNTNIQQKITPTVSIPAGNLLMSNTSNANLLSVSSASPNLTTANISTPNIVTSSSSTSAVVTTTSNSQPIMPKPKILPPSGIAPPPSVYSTRSTRAKALQNAVSTKEVDAQRRSTATPPVTSSVPSISTSVSNSTPTSTSTEALNQLHKQRTAAAVVLRQSQLNQHYQLMINGSTNHSKRLSNGGTGAGLKNGKHKTAASSGFRTLLSQLVTLQTDTLSVSRQRLELEERRLKFEQAMGDKLLTVLTMLADKP